MNKKYLYNNVIIPMKDAMFINDFSVSYSDKGIKDLKKLEESFKDLTEDYTDVKKFKLMFDYGNIDADEKIKYCHEKLIEYNRRSKTTSLLIDILVDTSDKEQHEYLLSKNADVRLVVDMLKNLKNRIKFCEEQIAYYRRVKEIQEVLFDE